MAGLLKPRAAAPLMQAIKEVTNLPVHFHTHDTSGASIASAMAMANAGALSPPSLPPFLLNAHARIIRRDLTVPLPPSLPYCLPLSLPPGCHIIDFATAALANCTSQPSLNAFLAGTSSSSGKDENKEGKEGGRI